jgi:hypothetical protein
MTVEILAWQREPLLFLIIEIRVLTIGRLPQNSGESACHGLAERHFHLELLERYVRHGYCNLSQYYPDDTWLLYGN